jgi:hypothetical protein
LHDAGWPKQAHEPIVVKIRLRPDISSEDRFRLSNLLKDQSLGLRIVFETHPLAEFYASPRARTVPLVGGVSIGVGKVHNGTIGGIVRDGTTFFGVTCSHVVPNDQDTVDQPAFVDSSASAPIGKRVAGTTLVGSKATDPCNAYNTNTPTNSLDVALIEIDNATSVFSPPEIRKIGAITGIVPRTLLGPGQEVEFSGKTSGHKRRILKGVGVPYRVTDRFTGDIHCFQHLLVFRTPWGNRRPSKGGDSGAWLCCKYGSGYGWTGMIIGGDGPDGYAVFADGIEKWWKAQGLSFNL